MSTPQQTKAEFLAAIGQIKQLDQDRLEALRNLRRVADSLIANPATTPDQIASIERDFESMRRLNVAITTEMGHLANCCSGHDVPKPLAGEGSEA